VFRDFEEANRSAPAHMPRGYNVPETAGFYRERLDRVHHDDYASLFWFEKALKDSRSIVEIGGHVGVAYYSFEHLVDYPEDLRWTIVDVPSVTEAGRDLAKERKRSNLHFVNELSEASPPEILIASGSLQYLPTPFLPERVRSMSTAPRHILINATPVTRNAGYVTLQNLDVSFCPYRIFSYKELVEPFLEMGYELVDSWQKNRKVIVPGHPECTVDHYSGYYLRRAS
jgi:putative methyltransferase (TIGR04325 family)